MSFSISTLSPDAPVLIAGATASGKSELALRIAEAQGGVIVNADAIQVFANWRVLTARPSESDLARAPHALYGHVPGNESYSVGQWLREISLIFATPMRPIIVGGTGLYFSALTEGLAEIPQTPAEIRAEADARIAKNGASSLLAEIDPLTREKIDTSNPMRIQRAWEVQRTTGRGLAEWQNETPPPLLSLSEAQPLLISGEKDWLTERINRRFGLMMEQGALEEAKINAKKWDPKAPSSKAIGAAELVAFVQGTMSREVAIERSTTLTRQFAKRQRTWFRKRMQGYSSVNPVLLF